MIIPIETSEIPMRPNAASLAVEAGTAECAMMLAGSADAFANALTGVYATDPHYGRSLTALMKALEGRNGIIEKLDKKIDNLSKEVEELRKGK